MTLREKLIEAGAFHTGSRGMAADVLDACLDCLAENADEWENEATRREILEYPDRNETDAGWLLAVLRDSDV